MPETLQLSMENSDQSKTMSRRGVARSGGTLTGNPCTLVVSACGVADVHTAGWDYREKAEHVW